MKNQNLNAMKKKFNLLVKGAFSSQKRPQTSLFSNKLNFFSSHSNFDFSSRDDHIRPLYEFGTDIKIFGCVGNCGYASASVKSMYTILLQCH